MSGEENKATLLELGAVEPLTKLLIHEDKIVKRNATMIFGILTSNSKYRSCGITVHLNLKDAFLHCLD